jgi:hypothetical protein
VEPWGARAEEVHLRERFAAMHPCALLVDRW